jgi:hypothetical protein
MKYILIIWICSFLTNECTDPIQAPIIYNSWKECVESAYKTSILILAENNDVEEYMMATKFICKEANVI